jgi:transcriptional regulator with XRE-family HTH domain
MDTEEPQGPAAALAELRARLEAGRVARGLNKAELARRAELGRTVVSQALSDTAPAHSAQTVGTLARALRLDVRPLLALLNAVSRAEGGRPRAGGITRLCAACA